MTTDTPRPPPDSGTSRSGVAPAATAVPQPASLRRPVGDMTASRAARIKSGPLTVSKTVQACGGAVPEGGETR